MTDTISIIIAAMIGVFGIFFGIVDIRKRRYQIICEYFSEIGSKEMIAARKNIYEKKEKIDELSYKAATKERTALLKDDDAAFIINFFDHWGYLVRKRYLSFRIYKNFSGNPLINMYEILNDVITERRKKDPPYADNFEWLYKKLKIKQLNNHK